MNPDSEKLSMSIGPISLNLQVAVKQPVDKVINHRLLCALNVFTNQLTQWEELQ